MRASERMRGPPPPFIDTKRGGVHVRREEEVVVSPRIGGAQRMSIVGSTLWGTGDYGAGRAALLGGVLTWRRSRRRPGSSSGRRGGSCRGYRPLRLTWRRSEGPAGGGLDRVKVRTTPEGRAHAVRGSCSRGGTRSMQHSGRSSAAHVRTVCRRFPQCRHSARDGGAVTEVGRWDPGHSHCAAWWPDVV